MKPFGKTYLIKCEKIDNITQENGIFIINDSDKIKDIYWKGIVYEHGTGWTAEEIKNLVPIGSKIIMTYSKELAEKYKAKVVLRNEVYMIRGEDGIIGVIEDD